MPHRNVGYKFGNFIFSKTQLIQEVLYYNIEHGRLRNRDKEYNFLYNYLFLCCQFVDNFETPSVRSSVVAVAGIYVLGY